MVELAPVAFEVAGREDQEAYHHHHHQRNGKELVASVVEIPIEGLVALSDAVREVDHPQYPPTPLAQGERELGAGH